MTISVTRVGTGEDFEFGPGADGRSQELTDRLYLHTCRTLRDGRELVECRMHDESNSPELVSRRCAGTCGRGSDCRRVHGILVALVKVDVGTSNEEWAVRHYDKRNSHTIRVGEGDEHKQEKDEYCAAASVGGGSGETEVSLPSGRTRVVCDALLTGSAGRFDIEVQRYHQTVQHAKGRTTRIRRAGVEPVWSTSRLTPWSERNAVPSFRTNDLTEFLGKSAPVRDQWLVVGGSVRVFAEPCHPRYGSACPTRGVGRYCGKEHPRYEPLPRLRVYEAVERLLAGGLVVVKLAINGAEVLMSPADRELYTGLGGAIITRGPMGVLLEDHDPAGSESQHDTTCTWEPREGFGDVLDRRQLHERAAQAFLLVPGGRPLRNCGRCSEPRPLADGLCLGCRLGGATPCPQPHGMDVPSPCASCGTWHPLGDEWVCDACRRRLGLRAAS